MPDAGMWRLRAAGEHDVDAISDLSLRTFGDEDGGDRAQVAHSVVNWRETRSPVVVARDDGGHFMGYAMVKPNRANDDWRIDGQVAVLTHLAVMPEHRGAGVGSALLERAVKTTRMLGWARLMAQVPPNLVRWYARRGWNVRPAGELLAWVEPWLARDDLWHPEFPSQAFSPLLFLEHRDDYPHLATLELSSDPPLLEFTVPVSPEAEDPYATLEQAVPEILLREPSLIRMLPPALVEMIAETPGLSKSARSTLLAESTARAGKSFSG